MKKEITLPKPKKGILPITEARARHYERNNRNKQTYHLKKMSNMSLWKEGEDGVVYYNSDTFLNPITGFHIKDNTLNPRYACQDTIKLPSRKR